MTAARYRIAAVLRELPLLNMNSLPFMVNGTYGLLIFAITRRNSCLPLDRLAIVPQQAWAGSMNEHMNGGEEAQAAVAPLAMYRQKRPEDALLIGCLGSF
jgi:hypothetical protein